MSSEESKTKESEDKPTGEECQEWKVEDFEFFECLGNGKFGYVYRAREKRSQKEVAIKVICKNVILQYNLIDQLKNEIEIQTRLIHPHIVRMYGYFYDNSYVYIIYECVTHGNLFEFMKSGVKLTEKESAMFAYQISNALAYLKKRNILHRDLKLENVMLNITSDGYTLKLSDFGWACQCFTDKRKTLCGTPEYIAPEILIDKSYDFHVDTWALGVMVYEITTGVSPFTGINNDATLDNIKNYSQFSSLLPHLINVNASEELVDFLCKLLEKDTNNRLSIEEVIEQKWIQRNLETNNNK